MRNYILGLLYVVTTMFSPAAIAVESILSANIVEGQATVKNYAGNKGHFEKNVNGVASYKDAAGTQPVNGTAGTALGITCTRSTSSPLAGLGSLLITKTSGASRQGEGCSMDFTIDVKDKAKPMRIAFDYLTAGTYVDADLSVWVYDVTNNRVIQPSGSSILGVLISDRKVLEFQTSSDSVSYRLIWHVGVSTDSANTVQIDDIEISRQPKATGAFISDWKPVTVTGTWSSNTTYIALRRQVGDQYEYNVTVATSGAPTATTLGINLPTGDTIDTSKLSSSVTFSTRLNGTVNAMDAGNAGYDGAVYYNNTTSVVPFVDSTGSSYATASVINNTIPFTFGSGDTVNIHFKVPIVGLSSSQSLSSDTDTRVVSLNVSASASNSLTDGVTTDIIPSSPTVIDTHGMYNSGTGVATIKVPGYYDISFYGLGNNCNLNAAERFIAYTVAGGNTYEIGRENVVTTGAQFPVASGTAKGILLKAGDTVKFQVLVDASCPLSAPLFGITRQSGPAQIAASDSITAIYKTSAAQSISNGGTAVTIVWGTKESDSLGSAMNTSTGVYTFQGSGTFNVCSAINYSRATVSITNNSTYDLAIYKNTALLAYLDYVNFSSSGANVMGAIQLKGCRLVTAVQGDVLEIKTANTNNGANAVLINSDTANYVSIVRVGNY